MTKTVKLKLLLSGEQKSIVKQLCERYRAACNYVSSWIFDNDFPMNFMRVQNHIYYPVRERFELNSQITISALKTVTASYKTVNEQLRQRHFKYEDENGNLQQIPRNVTWLQKCIQFKNLQCDLVRNRNYRFTSNTISFTTLDGTIAVAYQAPPVFEQRLNEGWTLGTAKLLYQGGKWFIAVPMSIKTNIQTQFNKIVGIDRGLRFVIAAADSQKRSFFYRGAEIMHRRHKFAKTRQSLQEKNTRSSKRRLKAIGHRENRWMRDVNHCIAKVLCDYYGSNTLFVLEDLTNITFNEKNLCGSAKLRQDKRSWAFYQLEQYLSCKAEAKGSLMIKVNPIYTSQRCPVCGIVDKNQRHHDKHEYRCVCGYRTNDDRIGALNLLELGRRYLAGESKPKIVKTRNQRTAEQVNPI